MKRDGSEAVGSDWADVYEYFAAICYQLSRSSSVSADAGGDSAAAGQAEEAPASALFRILTAREFTYLARKRCEPYRESIEDRIGRAIEGDRPVTLYFDIGGGYGASLDPERLPLCFTPGLGELCVLYQIRSFLERAQPYCPVPVRFTLVIDNLCARYVNGIPLESTQRYCAALRELLRHFDFGGVDLLVESERFATDDYERAFNAALADAPTPDAITPPLKDNVERFIGRRLDTDTALHQLARYSAGSAATEACLATAVDGVRLTQRATPDTLAFRAFPGGDVRIQCGEVSLAIASKGRVRPMLLSSANYAGHHKEPVDVADWGIPNVESINFVY